jgi:uncharacterized protein (DUF58 family)
MNSFIDEDFLKKLEKLKIATRKGTKGHQKGEHTSWQSGEGLEFLDYRKYHPGDDLRYVDWSIYGRLDKLFIKLFHAEKSQTVHILLDMSRSMNTGSPAKDISAKKIAAAVSYVGFSNLDKIGMMAFNHKIVAIKTPARGKNKYPEAINFLANLEASEQTDLNACLSEYALICKIPGIAVIISDFFDPKGFRDGLKALTHRKFDIHLIQLLDHEELFGMQTGNFLLTDVETGEKKRIFIDKPLLAHYRRIMDQFIFGIKNHCGQYGASYYVYDTRIPFEDFIVGYLTRETVIR